jgi:Cof subfamily protein (haloacid dehalogenase superfamily)
MTRAAAEAPEPLAGLFVSDIDGTLVTPEKLLTPAALAAAAELKAAGVPFTVVSSRPPRGMRRIVDALAITLPFAAFNGGNIVGADGAVLEAHRLPAEASRTALELIAARGVAPWAFADDAWFAIDPDGPHVAHERMTVGFDATFVSDFEAVIDRVDKIVAPSDDHALLDQIEREVREALGDAADVERSQTYYVDVTHPLANKGAAVKALARLTGVGVERAVVIGDMPNDIAMFRAAGFAIAMGQAPEAVKAAAAAVTHSDTDDGFAKAVQAFVLPRLAPARMVG